MNSITEPYLKNIQTIPTEVLKIISSNSKNFLVYERFHSILRKENLWEAIKYTQNNPFYLEGTFEQCINTFEEIMEFKD